MSKTRLHAIARYLSITYISFLRSLQYARPLARASIPASPKSLPESLFFMCKTNRYRLYRILTMGHCKTWTLDSGLDHGLDYAGTGLVMAIANQLACVQTTSCAERAYTPGMVYSQSSESDSTVCINNEVSMTGLHSNHCRLL